VRFTGKTQILLQQDLCINTKMKVVCTFKDIHSKLPVGLASSLVWFLVKFHYKNFPSHLWWMQ